MSNFVYYAKNQIKNVIDKEVSKRNEEISEYNKDNMILEWENAGRYQSTGEFFNKIRNTKNEIKDLEKDIDEKETKQVKIKNNKQKLTTLYEFLENINFYQNTDLESNIFYKGVLINSFYELEFQFPYADTDFNEILRCRCVSIGIPNIRKNYTSLNFNGRRIEIEQNAEFQHEIQLRIICDDEADIYYKFKEYIDFNKTEGPKPIFNGFKIYICLNGFKTFELNHITISDLGQLEFDNGPNSNICFFNVTLKIIDYKFVNIHNKQDAYDKLTFEILEHKENIKGKESIISETINEMNENSKRIENNNKTIKENKKIIADKKDELNILNKIGTYFK